MQALLEGLLPQAHAVQQGHSLFTRLAQLWSAKKQSAQHAQVLLLQARLSGLLAPPDTAIRLVQQAVELLTCDKVT